MRTVFACAVLLVLTTGFAMAGPLHDAARKGDAAAIFKLLEAGEPIDEQDDSGATALFLATLAGSFAATDQLILRQADMSIRTNDGLTPLHGAALGGRTDVMSFFIKGEHHNPMITIDIDDNANTEGLTPLMVAAEHGYGDLVAYLVTWQADVEKTDKAGRTVLTRAGMKGDQQQIVDILLRSRATCQEIDPAWFEQCTARKAELGL
jgi:uncharacterized protein